MGENAQANRKYPVRRREGLIRFAPKTPAVFPGPCSPVQGHGMAASAARRLEHIRFCVPLRIASADGG